MQEKTQKKLLLIDIDGMFYHSVGKETLEECMITFREKLQNCLDKTECTHWVGFVGKGKTFRNDIFNGYKSNRTQDPPKYLATLKEWGIAEFNLTVCREFESDDAVAYYYNKPVYWCKYTNPHGNSHWMIDFNTEYADEFEIVDVVLASPDKDILQGIACKTDTGHFNYTYKVENKDKPEIVTKGWFVHTSYLDSIEFTRGQLIIGDSADGVIALKGKGKAYWEKNKGNLLTLPEILKEYINLYGEIQGVYEFQKTVRLLHILNCDSDFERELMFTPSINDLYINTVPIKPEVSIGETNTF